MKLEHIKSASYLFFPCLILRQQFQNSVSIENFLLDLEFSRVFFNVSRNDA